MRRRVVFLTAIVGCWASTAYSQTDACKNPGAVRYIRTATLYAPDETRTDGLKIGLPTKMRDVPDRRPECLPLPVRFNNPGALQTPKAGPWEGQIGKDKKGHAIFKSIEAGVGAWLTWVQRRAAEGRNTPFKLMSMYAPPDDCVGSVDKLPNGKCPPGFPLNDTAGYAKKIAQAFGVGTNSSVELSVKTCEQRAALKVFLQEVVTMENGKNFCASRCEIDPLVFERAANAVSPSKLTCQ